MKKCLLPCLRNEEKPDALSFFLGIFFLRTLVYLVSYGPRCEKTCLRGGGGVDKECFKPVSLAIETSLKYEISPAASLHMILFKKPIKRRRSDCVDAQAGLRMCCSQTPDDRVSRAEAHIIAVFIIRAIVNELQPTFFFKFSSKVHSLLLNSFTFHLFYQAMF